MPKAELTNYFDVWGNKKDGFEVNNLCKEGEIELPKQFKKKDILEALKSNGFLKKHVRLNMLIIEDLYPYYEISQSKDYMPLCRIEILEEETGQQP